MKKKKNIKRNVGENIKAGETAWTFGGDTPEIFSGHIKRSVPFYEESHDLICKISDFFVKDNSVCYDVGTSTGLLIKKLAERHSHRKNQKWIGIDLEPKMIAKAKKEVGKKKNVRLVAGDVSMFPYKKSDFIVSFCTMQFVPPHIRQETFNRIYDSLNWGGAFVLFEKVRGCDARFQDMMQTLYADFKLDQGYTPDEIVAKTKSLKGILEPFSTQGNIDLLKRAGFVDIMTVFKYVCFEGFLAIK